MSNKKGIKDELYNKRNKVDEEKRKRKVKCNHCDYLVYIPIGKDYNICRFCGRKIFIDDKAKFVHLLNDKIKGGK